MQIMKNIKSILLLLTAVFMYTACGDGFLNKIDNTSINSSSFYKSESDAIKSVNAVYAPMQNISLWGRRIHFLLDFSCDEIGPTPNTQGPPLELILHTFGPVGNEHIDEPWRAFYRIISKANITIKNVGAMEDALFTTPGMKARVLGEAKFLRALAYFYINAIWNGGPLRTEANDTEISVARASAAEIWAQVEQDLVDAKNALPVSYPAADLGRVTKGAAQSLLGKAYLFQQKWSLAETEFMAVINSGAYYLMGGPNDPAGQATTVEEAIAAMRKNHNFGVKNIGESVFEVQFAAGLGGLSWNSGAETGRQESTIRPHEYGVDGRSFYNCKPNAGLIAAYGGTGTGIGERDPRVEAFYFTQNDFLDNGATPYATIFANSGYAWKKYQDGNFVSTGNDNDVNHDVIRYADVLLMAAEAKIQQDKVDEGIALINQIRKRADPTGAIVPERALGAGKTQAIDWLILERRLELAGEQTRRLDLVRWGIAKDVIPTFQVGKHEYFPIPQFEINSNQEMTEADQNPGY
jgi:starch-binding outer membrane protein, SusD/RagB family